MINRLILSASLSLFALLAPVFAYAQNVTGTIGGTASTTNPTFSSIEDVVSKACEVVNWLFTGALILTVVFVLLAAIKYITKGSDPKAVGDAHQMLIWAAIGFAIALLAAVAPGFIAGVLGADLPNSAC